MTRKKPSQKKRQSGATHLAPKKKSTRPTAVQQAIAAGRSISLLSPELEGWRLKQQWPRLFSLYVKGKSVRVELSHELNVVKLRIKRNLFLVDEQCITLAGGLWFLTAIAEAKKDSLPTDSFGFADIKNKAIDAIASTLSPHVFAVLSAKKESAAENARDKAVGLMKRTMNSLIRDKFPTSPRAAKDGVSKEWLALFSARDLVYELRRLPTKAEVIERLNLQGVDFSENSNSYKKDWADVFSRAGLKSLPE
jgi:hypothetical protein